jgi:hypothetical protein
MPIEDQMRAAGRTAVLACGDRVMLGGDRIPGRDAVGMLF